MIFSPFVFYCFFCDVVRRRNAGDTIRGVIATMLVIMPTVFVLLRLFFLYVVDVNKLLADCCAIGPVAPKNPLSGKVIGYTFTGVPLLIALGAVLYRKTTKNSGIFFEGVVRHELAAIVASSLLFIIPLPYALQGDGQKALTVLGIQLLVVVVFSMALWVKIKAKEMVAKGESKAAGSD